MTPGVAVSWLWPAVVIALVAACGSTPGSGPGHDALPAETDGARGDGSRPPPDAAWVTPDATRSPADAAAPDGAPPDAACVPRIDDGSANPYGIRFERVIAGMPVLTGSDLIPGAAIDDLDGDGDLDIVISRRDAPRSTHPGGPSTILWNDGPSASLATFRRDAAIELLTAGRSCTGSATADIDQDDDVDVAIACTGPDLLLENDGAGGFTDVAAARGVAGLDDDRTSAPIFADVNQDGLVDLYMLSYTSSSPPAPGPAAYNRLYLGRGAGRFEDVSVASGAQGFGASFAAVVANLDGDPELEIFVANDRFAFAGIGGILELQGDAFLDPAATDADGIVSYRDRGPEHGLTNPQSSMGVVVADLNEDGFDDLYVTDIGPAHVWLWYPPASTYLDDFGALGLDLGRNAAGEWYDSWSPRVSDFDRDGHLELSVTTGAWLAVNCDALAQRDFLFRRTPGAGFVDITLASGLPASELCTPAGEPLAGRAAIAGDLDGDGDDDLVITPYAEDYAFYRNETPSCGRTRLRVRPVGTVGPREAFGARLVVELSDGRTMARTLVGGGETQAQSARVLEVGLDGGSVDDVVEARLEWPGGYVQRLDLMAGFASAVALGATWTVVEPAWLTVSERTLAPGASADVIYTPHAPDGTALGAAGRGRDVRASTQSRLGAAPQIASPTPVSDLGDGRYLVTIIHSAAPGSVRMTLSDGPAIIRIAPVVRLD